LGVSTRSEAVPHVSNAGKAQAAMQTVQRYRFATLTRVPDAVEPYLLKASVGASVATVPAHNPQAFERRTIDMLRS